MASQSPVLEVESKWIKAREQNLMADSTRILLEEVIRLAHRIPESSYEADAHYLLGKHYFLLMQSTSARLHFLQARTLFQKQGDWEKTGFANVQLGLGSLQENVLDTAIAYFQQAITLYTDHGLRKHLWTPYMGISSVYNTAGNKEAAFRFARQAVASLQPDTDRTSKVIAYKHILRLARENDSLHLHAMLADDLFRLYSPMELDDRVLQHIDQYFNIEDPNARIDAILKSIQRLEEWPPTLELVSSYYQLGHAYREIHALPVAIQSWLKAYSIEHDSLQSKHFALALLQSLSQGYEQMQQLSPALDYFKQYESLKDSLLQANIKTRTEELQIQFESRVKDQQIAGQQELVRKLTLQRNTIIMLSLVLLAAGGYLFYVQRRHLRDQVIIASQQEILHQNELQHLRKEHEVNNLQTLINTQEEERKRIAQDLHDSLGGLIATLKINTRKNDVQTGSSVFNGSDALQLIDAVSAEVRRIAHNMMPPALIRMGLSAALEDLADAMQSDSQLDITYQNIDYDQALEQEQEITLYRIAQELCANVVRHADAKHMLIQLSRHNGSATLVVEDDGRGYDPLQSTKGMGMDSIRSRVEYLNGEMEVLTSPGQGTSITINVPVT